MNVPGTWPYRLHALGLVVSYGLAFYWLAGPGDPTWGIAGAIVAVALTLRGDYSGGIDND